MRNGVKSNLVVDRVFLVWRFFCGLNGGEEEEGLVMMSFMVWNSCNKSKRMRDRHRRRMNTWGIFMLKEEKKKKGGEEWKHGVKKKKKEKEKLWWMEKNGRLTAKILWAKRKKKIV